MMPAAMPAYGHKRPQRRREGNVTKIETEFATRLRFLVVWEAQRAAKQAVVRRLKGEGKRTSLMSASQLNSLAVAHLREHHRELFAAAEASGVVQDLRFSFSRRPVDPAAKSLNGSPVRNEATVGPSINKDSGEQQ
jgi:hypothetical protein